VVKIPRILKLFYRRERRTLPKNRGFEGLKVIDSTLLVPVPAKLDVRSCGQKLQTSGGRDSLLYVNPEDAILHLYQACIEVMHRLFVDALSRRPPLISAALRKEDVLLSLFLS
jgi:hypothetical protein